MKSILSNDIDSTLCVQWKLGKCFSKSQVPPIGSCVVFFLMLPDLIKPLTLQAATDTAEPRRAATSSFFATSRTLRPCLCSSSLTFRERAEGSRCTLSRSISLSKNLSNLSIQLSINHSISLSLSFYLSINHLINLSISIYQPVYQ